VSRITDVLRKAADEGLASGSTPRFLTGEAVAPLGPAEINVPWPIQEPLGRPTGGGERDADSYRLRVPVPAARTQPRGTVTDEDIVTLVAQVFRRIEGSGVRRVLFTAVDDGRGSADVAIRVAQALASQDAGSVCLVDLDVRTPTVDSRFQLHGRRGFSDALFDDAAIDSFVHHLPETNGLSIMPVGTRPLEAAAVIGGGPAQHRISELSEMFDYVVGLAAATAVHPDAVLLGPLFDGAVLVLEANATRASTARAAVEALQRATVNLVGTVLNNRTYPIPRAIYRWL
jgi:Mrp family chromosome partitioning ATPase